MFAREKMQVEDTEVVIYIPRDEDCYELYEYMENIEKHYSGLSDNAIDSLKITREVGPDLDEKDRESFYLHWIKDYIDGYAQLISGEQVEYRVLPMNLCESKATLDEDLPF